VSISTSGSCGTWSAKLMRAAADRVSPRADFTQRTGLSQEVSARRSVGDLAPRHIYAARAGIANATQFTASRHLPGRAAQHDGDRVEVAADRGPFSPKTSAALRRSPSNPGR